MIFSKFLQNSVADTERFDADPDPNFHADAVLKFVLAREKKDLSSKSSTFLNP